MLYVKLPRRGLKRVCLKTVIFIPNILYAYQPTANPTASLCITQPFDYFRLFYGKIFAETYVLLYLSL